MWKRDTAPKAVDPTPAPAPNPAPAAPPPTSGQVEAPPPRPQPDAISLGNSVVIKGELSASEDLTLTGQVEGRVTLPDHTLTVGPEADIRAEITASTVIVMGAVTGNVTASAKVEIRATGTVTGDLMAPRVVIADGGVILGKVQMTGEKAGARRTA